MHARPRPSHAHVPAPLATLRTRPSLPRLVTGFLFTLAVYLGAGFSFVLYGPTVLAAVAVLVSAVLLFLLIQRFAHYLGWDQD